MVLLSKWEDFEDELDAIEQRFAEHLNRDDYVIAEYKALRNVAMKEVVARLFPFTAFMQQRYGSRTSTTSTRSAT